RSREGVLAGGFKKDRALRMEIALADRSDAPSNPLPRERGRGRERFRTGQRSSLLLVITLALTGCAVGPNFHRPDPPPVNGYTPEPLARRTAGAKVSAGESQRFVKGLDIPGQWWTLFHSRALNGLVDEAIKDNPNLQSAQAAL